MKQQVCRDGAVMYIVQVCGCDFDVEIDAKRVQTVTADSDSETKQTTGSSSRFKIRDSIFISLYLFMIIYKPHPPLFCMCILYNYVVLFMLLCSADEL